MRAKERQRKLGDLVRELFLSPEMEQFCSLRVTPERAKLCGPQQSRRKAF